MVTSELILMVVYADVLMVLNLIVDYFLLSLTARIVRRSVRVIRLVLGSLCGAFFSLYIFLPQSFWAVELLVRMLFCGIMTLVTFGFVGVKPFFRCVAVLFCVTFGYAGAMMALWAVLKPYGMVINNSVVYFDISPVALTVCSVLGYFAVIFIRGMLEKRNPDSGVCGVEVSVHERSVSFGAIIDSGNSIEDVMGTGEIIIVDAKIFSRLFGDYQKNEKLRSRYRLIPCGTVSGGGLLEGYRCDRAVITYKEKRIPLSSPVVVRSNVALDSECPAIINPKVLDAI